MRVSVCLDARLQNEDGSVRQFDIVLGCDLVYDIGIVPALSATVLATLANGGSFYYISGGRRCVLVRLSVCA